MKHHKKALNITAGAMLAILLVVVICGVTHGRNPLDDPFSDGIEQIDLDTIYLKSSGVEVNFADIIVSGQNETRKLIVSTQTGTVSTKLTDRLIKKLDFNFMKKTQDVSYTGTGYFVVDLDNLTSDNVVEDKQKRTVTIRIDQPYLQAIEIDPNNIIIDEVKEGLFARGDIELSVADYTAIEKDLRGRLETMFNTAENGQVANKLALDMVTEIYEPIVKAVDRRYEVKVEFQ